MNTFDYIFFDLDGTLTDSAPGIINSVANALKHFGLCADDKTLRCVVGPPLMDSFRDVFHFDEAQCAEALKAFREYFSVKGLYENSVYEGIPEMLSALKNEGKTLVVATSKPEPFARQILSYFGLDGYFAYIAGAAMDESRTKKSEVLSYAMESVGLSDPSRVLMVGDREHDVLGAKAFGIPTLGVLYGYGSEEELKQAGAYMLAKSPWEIFEKITKNI